MESMESSTNIYNSSETTREYFGNLNLTLGIIMITMSLFSVVGNALVLVAYITDAKWGKEGFTVSIN